VPSEKKKKKSEEQTPRLGEEKRDGNRHRGESRTGAKKGKYRTETGDKEGQKEPPRGRERKEQTPMGEAGKDRRTGSESLWFWRAFGIFRDDSN
jgi:hypothetical protein